MKVGAIIPAAGFGQRMGGVKKAFMEIGGKPMLQYSVDAFLSHIDVVQIVVAISDDVPAWLQRDRITTVSGGRERADSVRNALNAMPDDVDTIIIHDAARPLITTELIDRVLEPVSDGLSATIALQSTDTLHEVTGSREISTTLDRSRVWRAQTPQAFPRSVLEAAFRATSDASKATDEAGLVAAAGWRVVVVPGETWNIKVTTPDDVAIAEAALRSR